MSILLTNVSEEILNQEIIDDSFNELKKEYKLEDNDKLTEIFYINDKISKEDWNLNDIKVNKFKMDVDKGMDDVYDNISKIIEDALSKKEFIDVIVDTSFLAYIILENLIKKYNITDVFILENNKLEKAHPCGCKPDYIGY